MPEKLRAPIDRLLKIANDLDDAETASRLETHIIQLEKLLFEAEQLASQIEASHKATG